ncbi:MAG TPA: nicotinate phosphoribosyltransferase [Acidimicrobiales bacterium]|nr:nicotinate phosphoribosyltransferase [Acidimicrobiales bacterium]
MPGGLTTDLYELNMAASYLRRGMTAPATFSLFVRRLPPNRGFLVAGGLGPALDWLERFGFDADDLDYLSAIGFPDDSVEAFGRLRFTGEVRAMPEGRVVFADEPLLEVTAPLPEAQLVETYLLNQITYQTALATKATRCRLAAAGRITLVEFGFRRTHGVEAGLAAARASAIAGFASTSNVEAARAFGLVPSGTMAHAYIEAFPTEVEAFAAFAEDQPGAPTFLVDTYDTASGVGHAIEVIRRLGLADTSAVRLDSGDLIALSFDARAMLDAAGLQRVRIFVSGGLDESDLSRLVAAGAPVDAAGIGTKLGVSADAPYLDSAYKLVEYAGRPVAKLSAGKATLPGAKQVFRTPGADDTIGLAAETAPPGAVGLLEQVMKQGHHVGVRDSLTAAGGHLNADLAALPSGVRRLSEPVVPVARISAALASLTLQVAERARRQREGRRPPDGKRHTPAQPVAAACSAPAQAPGAPGRGNASMLRAPEPSPILRSVASIPGAGVRNGPCPAGLP